MRVASANDVRAAIAAHVLGTSPPTTILGDIELHAHQRDGAQRIRVLLERYDGALLADEVGLGKTFVALAIARDARNPVVVAPAAIRDAWLTASRKCQVDIRFVSIEALSRQGPLVTGMDLVIVDEAHHLRSASTKRFAAASAMCRDAKVLLLSATPVQNSVRDLRTILSLFLGADAHALSAEELARFVVRRASDDIERSTPATMPRVSPPQWIEPIADVDCLERLLALPRAVPPLDGDDGGVLLTYTLLRQWSSSRAALRAALYRRLARAHAMEDALCAGRIPSRAELAAWCFADGSQQLAFPGLAVASTIQNSSELLEQVRRHMEGVRELLTWLDASSDPDHARVSALREIARRHRGERIVAFSEYGDTVAALYRLLVPDARVAMLTHGGGRTVGGPLSRREVLARFAPGSSARTSERDRIDILITTDVLSEGVDLHDASVVVHVDLAWNPARLAQRVGRLRRLGATRDAIAVYMFAPPAPAERLLRLEQRLRLKLDAAAHAVGIAGTILPGLSVETRNASAAREERISSMVRRWHIEEAASTRPVAATAVSSMNGAVVCLQSDGRASLVGIVNGTVTDSTAAIEHLIQAGDGPECRTDTTELNRVRELVEAWLRRRGVSGVVDLSALRVAHTRRALLHRVEIISRRAPRHSRPRLAPLMRAARSAATCTLSAGAERVLDELARSQISDTAWLQAVGEFAAVHARGSSDESPRVLAILILKQ
jgi:superfamily II DNA or RNA helicase